jgi:hypothetical protein
VKIFLNDQFRIRGKNLREGKEGGREGGRNRRVVKKEIFKKLT